jgi:hypothetical protein
MMRALRIAAVAAITVALFLTSGCGASRETVTVTERPDPIPSTEGEAVEVETPKIVDIPAGYDTVRAQRFDQGKMWTFDDPPVDYFREAYGVQARDRWFKKARLGALRFGNGCSASFVSPNGLVMTNHHCGREYITAVSQPGENLLDDGFYAETTEEERKAEDLHVDQLIRIEDVTDTVYDGLSEGGDTGAQARRQRVNQLEEQWTEEAKRKNERLRVEVVPLYSGAKYSKYTYRRYEDVRLVMAPELRMGFFGGAPDNFTYPRYSYDVAFFRVFDDGEPLASDTYFEWDTDGAEPGDAVFVVGNPGSTSRLSTVSQLKFQRDHQLPNRLAALRTRAQILESYIAAHPQKADEFDIRNTYFSLENSVKNLNGQLHGLRDPYLIARRAQSELALYDSIRATDSLQAQYGSVIDKIKQNQQTKRVMADKNDAFVGFASTTVGSRILTRGVYAYFYDFLRTRGASPDRVESIRSDALEVKDWPKPVEKQFIVARLTELRDAFGPNHPAVQKVLQDRAPSIVADSLVQNSALVDSSRYADLLDKGYLNSNDASVPVVNALAPLYRQTNQQMQGYVDTGENLNARLNRARFAVYGSTVPPDATFTLRIADGRVKSYAYNGTQAPAFTNFYGLYDHYYSYGSDAWSLPQKWLSPPADFDLETPFNLVTTNDISGGNSGSPLLNRDLEIVGLIFDSNIEALPNEYLYTNRRARAISVDARGILEALRDLYGADRIAQELTTGELVETEEEANARAAASSTQ